MFKHEIKKEQNHDVFPHAAHSITHSDASHTWSISK